ncbi:MAG TPA: ABC transporter ATP-binding protein [Polyangiaceae bacterium]|nr:ABC transporter ATP-binding protein [Polyangiaceae bacterium]
MFEATSQPILLRALKLLGRSWASATLAALLLLGTTICALSGPLILRYAVDHGLRDGQPDLRVIETASLGFLGLALASGLMSRGHTRLTGVVGERFVRDLRQEVFSHLLSMSVRYFDRHQRGRLVARLTSDIDALQDLIQLGLAQFVQSLLTLSALLIALLLLSWKLSLLSLLPLPILIVRTRSFQRRSREAYLEVRERVSATTSTLVENLAGAKVVQAFGQEQPRIDRFLGENQAQLEANLAAVRIQARYLPAVELTTALCSALALGGGGWLVLHGQTSLGTVSAFTLYLLMGFEPVQQLSFLFNTVQSAAAALQKLFALLDEPIDLICGTLALERKQTLSMRSVGFGYAPGLAPVLSLVALDLAHGERLALVGPTGAGKSTLAKLIARLYEPSTGTVCYGGVDLRHASHDSLRHRIVMVSQEEHLFQGSVADNVRAVRPAASDQQVLQALRQIGAYERFRAKPGGLAAPVGERGALLSAGERQLVALARVALLSADVLILDEPTSSLDPGTEREVNIALESLMRERTVVLIAHRLSTMKQVDRIAVVADGRIAEIGSHSELLARQGQYAALYRGWERGGGQLAAGS